jgi:acetylornithine deacetylase/succinyl-diaminopimelate desuccinylase-like protein
MLFVRCGNGGISHSPRESVSAADADLAARALREFLVHFGAHA